MSKLALPGSARVSSQPVAIKRGEKEKQLLKLTSQSNCEPSRRASKNKSSSVFFTKPNKSRLYRNNTYVENVNAILGILKHHSEKQK